MSLSNKILIGFFASIFLYLTAAFAEIRLTGIPNIINDDNSTAETVDIGAIAYIVVDGLDENVNVARSDRARLEVRSFTGDWLKKLTYKISGDTLTLSHLQAEPKRMLSISVYVAGGLKGLTVKKSGAIVEGLEQESLKISQNSGRIWMSDSRITEIEMSLANHSVLDISDTAIDTLSADIDESQMHVFSSVGLLRCSLKNSSFLRVHEIREIQLKKDQGSKINMFQ